jgi:hypothetical protein
MMEVTLSMEQADDPPPSCPECDRRDMQQEFRPVALGGSNAAKAHGVAERIISEDYHVADFNREHRRGGTPAVRYNDQTQKIAPAAWGAASQQLEMAISAGRETRMRYGSSLDIIQREPDLIKLSKERMRRERMIL